MLVKLLRRKIHHGWLILKTLLAQLLPELQTSGAWEINLEDITAFLACSHTP